MTYTVRKMETIHGRCPPGYEHVKSHSKKDGSSVHEYCRKIKVQGRGKALFSGLYNETMIAQEDARLGFDTIIDSTQSGERNAKIMKERTERMESIMREQEKKKMEARKEEK